METSLSHNSNLAGHRAQAPHSESVDSKDIAEVKPTHLTKNGIWNLQETANQKLQTKQNLVLQITSCKVFPLEDKPVDSDKKKAKLQIKAKYNVSDGVSTVKALVPDTNYAKLVKAPKLYDVIKIENFQKTIINGQTLLMLKDPLTVLYDDLTEKIGSPKDLKEIIENKDTIELGQALEIPSAVKESVQEKTAPVSKSSTPPTKLVNQAEQKPVEKKVEQKVPVQEHLPVDLASNNYMPIKALNTFSRDWIIKARVANKGEKRTTQKGGQLLKIEMVDKYGSQIEGTFFNDAANKFDTILEKDKVYLFSCGQIKMANKRYTSVRNDFCIVFEKNSEISEAQDDGSISNQAFDFCSINDIQEIMQMKTIDVVGVISEIGEMETINLKSGQQKIRKQIQLVDNTQKSISLTLWGEEACKKCQMVVGDIMGVKAARCSEFGGRSLNASDDHAQLFKESEIAHPQAKKLAQWHQTLLSQNGGNCDEIFANYTSLTQKPQSRGDGNGQYKSELEKKQASNLNLICEMNDSLQQQNDTDKLHFFFLNGYVSRIKNDERIFYPACKSETCRRKVVEDSNGYRCEHCGKTYSDYNPTYMITAMISDFTESIYISFAREHGTSLMGMSAEAFRTFKEQESEATVQKYFDDLLFKSFNIMVKGKYEYFNGENRMKYFAVKVFPHNVVNENKALLSRLDMYSKMDNKESHQNMTIGM